MSLALLVAVAAAQLAMPAPTAHIQAPALVQAPAHGEKTVAITITIDNGFHIQSNHPKLDYLIPSSVTLTPADGISVARVVWPTAKDHTFSFSKTPLAVFEGTIRVPVTLKTSAAGDHLLHGIFRYQACNDQECRPPVNDPFTLHVRVR